MDEENKGSLAFVRSSGQGSQHRSLGISSSHWALSANGDPGCQYCISFPLAAGSDPNQANQEGTTTQYLRPDTSSYFTSSAYEKEMTKELAKYKGRETIQITTENYMEVMELIYLYPNDFVGKKVTYTGFVYNDPQTMGYQFIFRFGIIHCIADSGVYGLATTGSDQTFKDNTWVTVTGTITVNYYQNLKQSLPILNLTEIKEVSQPDNPYVYRVF